MTHKANINYKNTAGNGWDHADYSTGNSGIHRVRSRRAVKRATNKAIRQAAKLEAELDDAMNGRR